MSAKEVLFKLALNGIRLLELCTMGQAKKTISKKEYTQIKGVIQEIQELAEQLP